ncbi:MAG: hypothetical protein FOGNACKC_02210 [Anaerolineae bacterium]|nr:hypothetical protein [Anaerolineae bacterium]
MSDNGLAMSRFAYFGIPDDDDFDPTAGEFDSDVPAADSDFDLPARDINDDLTGDDFNPVSQLNNFDYRQLDAETRIVVQQRTGEIKSLMKRTAQDIIEIGEKLIEVKGRLPHGAFGIWLESEFQWSDRTARKYMSIASTFSNRKSSSDLMMSFETMAYLAAPSTPEPARQAALARAQAGERITHSAAKEIVTGHKTEQCSCGQVGAFPRGSWTCDGCLTYCSKLEAQYEDKRGLVCKKCHQLIHAPAPAEDENLPAWLTEDDPPAETAATPPRNMLVDRIRQMDTEQRQQAAGLRDTLVAATTPEPATRLTEDAPQPNRNGVESTAPAAPSPQPLTADNWTVGYCPNCRHRYVLNNDTIAKNLFVGCPKCNQPHRAATWVSTPDSQLLTPDSSRNGMSQPMAVFMSSGENEWYTPAPYIDRARQVLGRIDLDPASSDIANQVVQAATYFTSETDGLSQLWPGRVWLNPPFDASAEWSSRLAASYEAGQTEAAVLLVKVAFGYNWFNELWENYPICLARERISFVKPDGTVIGPHKVGSAFFYFGEDFDRFAAGFADVGRIIEPE